MTISAGSLQSNSPNNPIAVGATATTAENTAVTIPVLQNDTGITAALNPASVTIVQAPKHGSLSLDPTTGNVTYTPAANFYGNDSFTYQVSDANGLASNVATVSITITAAAQTPILSVSPASGNQDAAIPLTINVSLPAPDPNDTLYVEISQLAPGATLSAGTLVGPGDYRLTIAQLQGLTFTSPQGLSGDYTLSVEAVSTETTNGSIASVSATLPVTVNTVTPNPLEITGFVVNGGQAQRSLIETLAVSFNQNVVFSDAPNDFIVTTQAGIRIDVPPADYSYNATAFTLTIKVQGLIMTDGEYLLSLNPNGVAVATDQAVTLASGESLPVDSQGYVNLQFFRLLANFTGSGEVTYADYTLWAQHNSTSVGQPGYNVIYDLNNDGVIDRFDYAIWRQQLYKIIITSPPAISGAINPASGGVTTPVYEIAPAPGSKAAPTFTTTARRRPALSSRSTGPAPALPASLWATTASPCRAPPCRWTAPRQSAC